MEHKKQAKTAQTGQTHRAPALSAVRCPLSAASDASALSAVRDDIAPRVARTCRLSALFALGLCAWLGADTKPTDPEPSATRRMVTIDGSKQRVYPLSIAAQHSFKALDLRLATEQLKAKAPDLDTCAEALQRYDAALQAIEAEVGE